MSNSRAREGALEREFDALLEDEFAGEPPVAAILKRAEHGPQERSRSRARSWLAAALALFGIGVAVALAWNARADRADRDSVAPQDPDTPTPDTPIEVRWPAGVMRISDAAKLSTVPRDATHLELVMPLHVARDLSRFDDLQHLSVRLTPMKMARLLQSGSEAKVRGRLDALATTPRLRSLSIGGLPLADADLAGLRHAEQLQTLELAALLRPDGDYRAAAARGGMLIGRPFDRSFGAAVATSSRAKALRLASMPITAAGLQALAGAELNTLIIDTPQNTTPDALLALGELTSLRHLELRFIHGVAVEGAVGGSVVRQGSRALSVAVMERIAALPELRSLTLDVCFLDHELVAALPRQLHRLDIGSCFGVDGRLADVVAAMPELRELGLPLAMTDGKAFMTNWRPPITDTNAHTLRLSGDEARAIIGSRAWQALRLDGRLTAPVTAALANQAVLQELTLTPSPDSESLAFVAQLPKLERVTFVQADISGPLLLPLNECASLRAVDFHDCVAMSRSDLAGVLRDDIVTRWGYRMVW